MLRKIRRFFIKHDPSIQALKPQVSDNLHTPLEASTKDLSRPGADSLPQTNR